MAGDRDRWIALDGLRAVAVLFVLFYHFGAPFGTGGYLGVDLFFVVSGCVITTSLRRSLARGGTISDFFWRRVARLFPNLMALSLVAFALDTWRDRAVLTSHNLAILEELSQTYDWFLAPDIPTPHLWSLSMEWQFYVFLALLFLALGARRLTKPSGWMVAMVIALISIACKVLLPKLFGMSLLHVYFWPFTRLDGFMLGVAVALLVEQGQRLSTRWLPPVIAVAILATMVFSPRWWSAATTSLFVIIPLVSIGAAIVVWGMTSSGPQALLNRILGHPIPRYLGERSYSIYLWHYFVGVALIAGVTTPMPGWEGPQGEGWRGTLIFALQMAASVGVAVLAYEAVENPCRLRLNRQTPWFGLGAGSSRRTPVKVSASK